MKQLAYIGDIAVADFMAQFWQREAYLARQALPACKPVLDIDVLLRLSTQEDVESRLIVRRDEQSWSVDYGPFTSRTFKKLPSEGWTVLVQGVNLWRAEADALLRQFAFIPYARLDDLMISYATNGGGVGPHFDSYDVFLLQTYGQRQWSVSTQEDLTLLPDLPLKILKHFKPENTWVLDPGDMLYLPPRYAHDGIAVGECMTCSIGFRAPIHREWAQGFLNFWHDQIELSGVYQDIGLKVTNVPALIPEDVQCHVKTVLQQIVWSQADINRFVGCYLTEPKETTFFNPPTRPLSYKRFCGSIKQAGVVLDSKTQMLYDRAAFYCNGEVWLNQSLSDNDQGLLCELANRRTLGGDQISLMSESVTEHLYEAYRSGFLNVC